MNLVATWTRIPNKYTKNLNLKKGVSLRLRRLILLGILWKFEKKICMESRFFVYLFEFCGLKWFQKCKVAPRWANSNKYTKNLDSIQKFFFRIFIKSPTRLGAEGAGIRLFSDPGFSCTYWEFAARNSTTAAIEFFIFE